MKMIELGSKSGLKNFAKVDDEDFERVSAIKWHLTNGYAVHTQYVRYDGKKEIQRPIYMHRFIMGTPDGMDTDHVNSNKLDNRKQNLRVCTRGQNICNRRFKKNSSYSRGTRPSGKKWFARITINRKIIHLGTYETIQEAANAYDEAAKKYHGKFAVLNSSDNW